MHKSEFDRKQRTQSAVWRVTLAVSCLLIGWLHRSGPSHPQYPPSREKLSATSTERRIETKCASSSTSIDLIAYVYQIFHHVS